MHTIDLTQAEAGELKQVLDNKLVALLNELAHTDDRDFRVSVRGSITTLEQVQAKLQEAIQKEPTAS